MSRLEPELNPVLTQEPTMKHQFLLTRLVPLFLAFWLCVSFMAIVAVGYVVFTVPPEHIGAWLGRFVAGFSGVVR